MEFYLSLTALVLCAYAGLAYAGKCPTNHAKIIKSCAQDIEVNIQSAQGHKFITDPEYTTKICEGGEIDKAIDCMETVYKDCTESGIEDKDLPIKPESWRSAVKEVCKNKKFLADNASCMKKSRKEMNTCVQNFTNAAQVQRGLKQVDFGAKGKTNQRELYQLICGLSENLMTCFDKTLLKHCPPKLERIMDDVLHKFLPPVCHPAENKTSYKTINDTNTAALSLPATVTLVVSVFMCLRSMV
ncbi:uncharacterized protein [Haliotis cracherodii]|uniref:uncharacterized protein isoform X1 n=1 Tax=Haliotis cracherodii TaxID=6455 RepID=UPI0039ED752D